MKTIILPFFAFFIFSHASGQLLEKGSLHWNTMYLCDKTMKDADFKKTRVVMQRLILDSVFQYNHATLQFDLYSTRNNHYAGQRGHEFYQTTAGFDMYIHSDTTDYAFFSVGQNKNRLINEYNAANECITETQFMYNVATLFWDTIYKIQYAYQNNNVIQQTANIYSNNLVVGKEKLDKTYNINNDMLSASYYDWNDLNQVWVPNFRYLNTYNGLYLTEILSDDWNGMSWETEKRRTFTYNANNKKIVNKLDFLLGNQWIDGAVSYYIYDLNNRLDTLHEISYAGPDSSYLGFTKYIYNGNDTLYHESHKHRYNINLMDTIPDAKNVYIFDVNKNLTQINTALWDTSINTWGAVYYYNNFYYEDYTFWPAGIADNFEIKHLTLFPNPATVYTCFQYMDTDNTPSVIRVRDVAGKLHYSVKEMPFRGKHLVKIPIENLTPGLYFISLEQSGQIQHTLKFIRE